MNPSDPSSKPLKPAPSRVRVRSRPLDQVDEAKLAVALSIMARRLLQAQQAAERDLRVAELEARGAQDDVRAAEREARVAQDDRHVVERDLRAGSDLADGREVA